jgi:OFA family oxalate/formate antiporter-like MFS transporter
MTEQVTEKKIFNRWIIAIGAIMVQFGLGILYSWGMIQDTIVIAVGNDVNVKWAYALALATFAAVMIPAGKLQDKYGPKMMAIIGGTVFGTSYLLCAPVINTGYIILIYGIMGGAGIGLAYVCPLACATKWFPDKKGLISGLAVAGFGLGSFAFNFIMQALLTNLSLMFIVLGIILYALVIGGGSILHNPQPGYKPVGWNPPAPAAGVVKRVDWTPKQIIKTKQFWLWWASFAMSAMIGLLIIGSYKTYIKAGPNYTEWNALGLIAVIGSVAAVGNAAGRIGWGKIGDKIGRYKALMIMNIIQAIVIFCYAPMNQNIGLAILMVTLIYFCFGGNLAVYPAITADNFGTKNYGINYGTMFSAYGVAGVMQAVFIIVVFAEMTVWLPLFMVLGVASLIAATILFLVKPPIAKTQ